MSEPRDEARPRSGEPREDGGPSKAPELEQVLRALREEGPGAVRLERVAQRLGPLLDAALPAPPAVSVLQSLLQHVLRPRLLLVGLALGATVYLWPTSAPPPRVERSVQRAPLVASESPRVQAPPLELAPPPPELAPPAPAPETSAPQVRAARAEARPRRPRASTLPASQQTVPPVDALPVDALPVDALPVAAPVALQPEPPAEVAQVPQPPRPKSELDLIYEARTLAVKQPAAALRLLEEHAARFADGLLAPEREVLAIEVLRRLGKAQAAQARLQAFRQRYPSSVHLRRLEQHSH